MQHVCPLEISLTLFIQAVLTWDHTPPHVYTPAPSCLYHQHLSHLHLSPLPLTHPPHLSERTCGACCGWVTCTLLARMAFCYCWSFCGGVSPLSDTARIWMGTAFCIVCCCAFCICFDMDDVLLCWYT